MTWTHLHQADYDWTPSGVDDTLSLGTCAAGTEGDNDNYLVIAIVQYNGTDGGDRRLTALTVGDASAGLQPMTRCHMNRLLVDDVTDREMVAEVWYLLNVDASTPIDFETGFSMSGLASYSASGGLSNANIHLFVYGSSAVPAMSGDFLKYIQGGVYQNDQSIVASDDAGDSPDEGAQTVNNPGNGTDAIGFVIRTQAAGTTISGVPPYAAADTYDDFISEPTPNQATRVVTDTWQSSFGIGMDAGQALAKRNSGTTTALSLAAFEVSETGFLQRLLVIEELSADRTPTQSPLLVSSTLNSARRRGRKRYDIYE